MLRAFLAISMQGIFDLFRFLPVCVECVCWNRMCFVGIECVLLIQRCRVCSHLQGVCDFIRLFPGCMYVCLCMYVCVYVCMYVCVYVCMYACMHACMHACMYV